MHVKRHLSRLFGSFRLKGKTAGHSDISEEVGKENQLSRRKSLREKVSAQLSTISNREKNKTSSRWQLLDTEANPDGEEVNWLSNTYNHPPSTLRTKERENSDNLLNGQLEVPVLVEVRQAPKAPTLSTDTSAFPNDSSLRVHSASRSDHKDSEEESGGLERVLLDSSLGYEYISNCSELNSCISRNSSSGIPTAATLTKPDGEGYWYEEELYHDEDDDYQKKGKTLYELQKSGDKKEKKSSKLYRYASFRFRSFNKKNKKNQIGRSLSLRSMTVANEDTKSIDSKTRNRRVKLQKVKQQEVLDIIKPWDSTTNSSTITKTANSTNSARIQYDMPNGVGKGFRKNIQRKLSIKAFKKSGTGMGKKLKGGFAAMAKTMIHISAVAPIPYECPPTSVNYDSYWGNDYQDYSTYKDYHYQLEYNSRRYSNTSFNGFFHK